MLLQTILIWVQPITVIAFVISAVVSLLLGLKEQGVINICFAVANYLIFYGGSSVPK